MQEIELTFLKRKVMKRHALFKLVCIVAKYQVRITESIIHVRRILQIKELSYQIMILLFSTNSRIFIF